MHPIFQMFYCLIIILNTKTNNSNYASNISNILTTRDATNLTNYASNISNVLLINTSKFASNISNVY